MVVYNIKIFVLTIVLWGWWSTRNKMGIEKKFPKSSKEVFFRIPKSSKEVFFRIFFLSSAPFFKKLSSALCWRRPQAGQNEAMAWRFCRENQRHVASSEVQQEVCLLTSELTLVVFSVLLLLLVVLWAGSLFDCVCCDGLCLVRFVLFYMFSIKAGKPLLQKKPTSWFVRHDKW